MSALLCTILLTAAIAPTPAPTKASPVDFSTAIDRLALRVTQVPHDRRLVVVRPLRALGHDAVPVMIDRLAHDSTEMATLRESNPSAMEAFDVALVEALGDLHDPRALPTFEKLFESGASDPRLVRSAADGLGKLCDLGGFAPLAAHASVGDALHLAASSGLGHCRELRSATLLVDELPATGDGAELKALAQSLGQVASSWGWQAMGPSKAAEGAKVKHLVATALLDAYARAPELARLPLAEALVMTDDPSVEAALNGDARYASVRPLWRRAHLP